MTAARLKLVVSKRVPEAPESHETAAVGLPFFPPLQFLPPIYPFASGWERPPLGNVFAPYSLAFDAVDYATKSDVRDVQVRIEAMIAGVSSTVRAHGARLSEVEHSFQELRPEVEDHVTTSTTAQLPSLPSPLQLRHGPLIVTIDTWSDGTVVARIPALALEADGENDILALDSLREVILDFARSATEIQRKGRELGGPLLRRWDDLNGLIDLTGLGPPE